ncbi:MAG: prolipoprotein diacylglyceryl transferase [Dorea sp.]|nr:prolipoprotein diacylglyceryl transferase [Dorea sp.]MDY2814629.1 prolipoprotein diacylglyceryl transferase [Dorea sp.]
MHKTIDFPNIGIHLQSVGDHISVFGFDIAYYGIIIGIGILVGLFIAVAEAKRTGQKADDYYDLVIYAVIFSIIGARAYYVIFSWDMYKDDLKSILNIRQGGLAIYGGVIAAVITVFVFARIKKLSPYLILDTAGLGLVSGQMIGRWGNFFNREAFGEYTDSLFAMRLPEDAVRQSDITDLMRQHMETVNGVNYIQVHPTYLYESLWCLMVLVILLLYRKHKKFDGEVFLIYLMGYGLGRVWIEGLRTDQLLLPKVGLPVSQLLAGTLVVVSLILILFNRKRCKKQTEIK